MNASKLLFRVVCIAVTGLTLGYLLLCAALAWTQESLLFPGGALAADYRFQLSAPHDEWTIDSDGVALSALRIRSSAGRIKGVVIYFHGNGGSIADWLAAAPPYLTLGYDVVLTDYRGYGKSGGSITSEEQLHRDAGAVYDRVAREYPGRAVILVGRSLGSGIAARLAARVRPKALILETPYLSFQKVVEHRMPYLPVGLLLKYPLRTEAIAAAVTCPTFVIHGDQDELVPFAQGEQLSRLFGGPTRLYPIRGGGHNSFWGRPAYAEALADIDAAIK